MSVWRLTIISSNCSNIIYVHHELIICIRLTFRVTRKLFALPYNLSVTVQIDELASVRRTERMETSMRDAICFQSLS